jgi:outer membrane biosynthesis protein TonB
LAQTKEAQMAEAGPRPTRGGEGGGGKWVLAALAVLVLAGGGYLAWSAYSGGADQPHTIVAEAPAPEVDDADLRGAVELEEPTPAPVEEPRVRRPRPAPEAVPVEVIGVTLADSGADNAEVQALAVEEDDIIVRAPRRPIWVRTPNLRRLSSYYPVRALDRGREGEASLHCTILQGGALDCVEASATPGGFGSSALRLARSFRHSETLSDGSSAIGTPVNLRVLFRLADDGSRRRRS